MRVRFFAIEVQICLPKWWLPTRRFKMQTAYCRRKCGRNSAGPGDVEVTLIYPTNLQTANSLRNALEQAWGKSRRDSDSNSRRVARTKVGRAGLANRLSMKSRLCAEKENLSINAL